MSDTPQTDDLARGNHVVPTEWAEQLERERDCAKRELHRLTGKLGNMWEANMAIGHERNKYKNAILECLDKNSHLADGEDCTLIGLKKALR